MEDPPRDDPQQVPRRSIALALAPILIVGLLGVVAIVSAGRRAGGGTGGHGPGTAFYEYLISTLFVVMVVAGLALFYVVLRGRLLRKRELRPAWSFRGARLLFYLLVFFVIILILREPILALRQRLASETGAPPQDPGSGGAGRVTDPQQLEFRWAPVFVAVGLFLVVAAVLVAGVLRKRALRKDPRTVELALADVMDDALDDIRAERDARKAIIAAYARMERLLGGYGRARAPSEAPFEYLGRVLIELRVSRHPVESLTELFERAKFSAHALGGEDKNRAIAALEAVRDELRDPVEVVADQAPVPA